MSERSYFDLRYTISGFVFIILILGLNYFPLFVLLKSTEMTEIVGAFLAFFTLFSGSAIGFLISQVWWCIWEKRGGLLGDKYHRKSFETFEKKYDIGFPSEEAMKNEFHTAIDYATHLVDKKILTVAKRRWDLFHILSATFYSLWLGLVFGFIIRICFQFILFDGNFSVPNSLTEPLILISLFAVSMIMLPVLHFESDCVHKISASLHNARINMSEVDKEQMRTAFPDLYQQDSVKESKPQGVEIQ